MGKKEKKIKAKQQAFNNDPFRPLKGFAVSSVETKAVKHSAQPEIPQETFVSFEEEMQMLGVYSLENDDSLFENPMELSQKNPPTLESQTDEELFLAAMSHLKVNFKDHIPDADRNLKAIPRRMKRVKQGRLVPEATLDMHGCQRLEVVPRLRRFLQNAQHNDFQTVLVITGKGLHSESGEAVVRKETEKLLSGDGMTMVVEWGTAPKQYGGEGALVIFLRKKC